MEALQSLTPSFVFASDARSPRADHFAAFLAPKSLSLCARPAFEPRAALSLTLQGGVPSLIAESGHPAEEAHDLSAVLSGSEWPP